jgi:GntR family transcriptional regulator, arabinose operon transcriptional repressor
VRKHGKPKYLKIYEDLVSDILDHRYELGDKIASEKEIALQYQVSRITSKKALDMAAEEGYIQKRAGLGSFVTLLEPVKRKLRKKKTVAIVLPGISHFYGQEIANQLFMLARQDDCILVTCLTENKLEYEKDILIKLEEDGVDGYIIYPVNNENFNNEIFKIVISGKPIILIDKYLQDLSCPNVVTNNFDAAYQGVTYLFDLGHRNIGFLSRLIDHTSTIRDRKDGVYKAFTDRRWTVDQDAWLTGLSPVEQEMELIEETKQLIKAFILRHPKITAYFCFEYIFYLLFDSVARDLGIRIPEDLSVICFDAPTTLESELIPVTCLKQDESLIAQTAYCLLKDRMAGNEVHNDHKIKAVLIPGKTTAPPKTITI